MRLLNWNTTCLRLILACASGWAVAAATAAEPDAEGLRFFEAKVRPILVEHCQDCHGTTKQESDLRLDSRAATLAGGASGAAVVPGDPDASLLIQAIRYPDTGLQMPPKAKLPADKIATLVEWVKRGAPYPATEGAPAPSKSVGDDAIAAGRQFWAFQAPQPHPVPRPRDAEWPRTPIDAFILAELEVHQRTPAAATRRPLLLRRLTFDLTGLPPTPDEVASYAAATDPDATARVVDRLLASPHYGQRWARHWLDVARYADSNGLDENVAHGNAWRYRDYVVDALNQDKPYDEFLREQLAGDLLEPPLSEAEAAALDPQTRSQRYQRLIATGFLALGPKVLAEVDERKMEMDIVDEQIDTFGKAILGLTLGCARCHDHKFDPIATKDYYALAGVFKSTRTMENFKKVARWHENSIPTPDEVAQQTQHRQKVAAQKQAIEQFLAGKPEAELDEAGKAQLKQLRDELAALEKAAPQLSTAMGVSEGQAADVPLHVRGSHLTLGQVVPRGVPRVLVSAGSPPWSGSGSGRDQLADWLLRPDHPLTTRVLVNRVWRWHFGHGIVRSTDNFGRLGEKPTHPELLDWLALRFMSDGWSLKQLHRLLVLSSVYELSSDRDEGRFEADPENRWWGRQEVRRLEAEAIRDALLAVSGRLDTRMGGSLLHVGNRQYLFDHTSKDGTKYDSPRRSLYLPVIRNNMYDVFQLFDYADSAVLNGDRDSTVVAPQALFLLNSPLVLDASAGLASAAQADAAGGGANGSPTDVDRIAALVVRCFGRAATAGEIDRARRFLDAQAARPGGDRAQAWVWLSQTLLASSEFIYLR